MRDKGNFITVLTHVSPGYVPYVEWDGPSKCDEDTKLVNQFIRYTVSPTVSFFDCYYY